MKKLLALLLASQALTGCIVLSSTNLAEVVAAADAKGEVEAEASSFGFLSLTVPAPSELERAAVKELSAKGGTKNISTRLTMRNFVVVQSYTVTAVGQK